jgi:CheY-like chemotaxis protein
VLDFDMPGANGLQVLRNIRAEAGRAPCLVIMLTANSDASVREACMAAGADHFLLKTSDMARLPEIVTTHVGALAAAVGRNTPDVDSTG